MRFLRHRDNRKIDCILWLRYAYASYLWMLILIKPYFAYQQIKSIYQRKNMYFINPSLQNGKIIQMTGNKTTQRNCQVKWTISDVFVVESIWKATKSHKLPWFDIAGLMFDFVLISGAAKINTLSTTDTQEQAYLICMFAWSIAEEVYEKPILTGWEYMVHGEHPLRNKSWPLRRPEHCNKPGQCWIY